MSDTQKTTKAVREARIAPEDVFEGPYRDLHNEVVPRYTVELTTEGWQIKDNGRGIILADYFKTKRTAEKTVEAMNLGADNA